MPPGETICWTFAACELVGFNSVLRLSVILHPVGCDTRKRLSAAITPFEN